MAVGHRVVGGKHEHAHTRQSPSWKKRPFLLLHFCERALFYLPKLIYFVLTSLGAFGFFVVCFGASLPESETRRVEFFILKEVPIRALGRKAIEKGTLEPARV